MKTVPYAGGVPGAHSVPDTWQVKYGCGCDYCNVHFGRKATHVNSAHVQWFSGYHNLTDAPSFKRTGLTHRNNIKLLLKEVST